MVDDLRNVEPNQPSSLGELPWGDGGDFRRSERDFSIIFIASMILDLQNSENESVRKLSTGDDGDSFVLGLGGRC